MADSIGQKIKKYRNCKDLTQLELAKLTNLSRSYIAGLERNAYNPSIATLTAIAVALSVPTEALLEENTVPQDGYYLDPEAAKMAQELYDNPGMRILFDAARNVSADDLKLAAEIIGRMKKEEEHDVD
jgi:transcriptional regulator with XRE-family HTH domain|nr:MAG TPA: helix-turn-helix domain protein [Caudoviricetes sp.]